MDGEANGGASAVRAPANTGAAGGRTVVADLPVGSGGGRPLPGAAEANAKSMM